MCVSVRSCRSPSTPFASDNSKLTTRCQAFFPENLRPASAPLRRPARIALRRIRATLAAEVAMPQRFAVIGLDHRHIYELTQYTLDAGMECAGYWPTTTDTGVLEGFRKRFPDLPAVAERERLLDDPAINVIVSASVP